MSDKLTVVVQQLEKKYEDMKKYFAADGKVTPAEQQLLNEVQDKLKTVRQQIADTKVPAKAAPAKAAPAKPNKYLPASREWPQIVNNLKLKENGLGDAIERFRALREDQFDMRMAALKEIATLAAAQAKSKEVIAAGPKWVKWVSDIATNAIRMHGEIAKDKSKAMSQGMRPLKVQIMVSDWNNSPFKGYTGFVDFRSPGVPTVTVTDELTANGLDIDSVTIFPTGTMNLRAIKTKDTSITVEGTTAYECKPSQKIMKFTAVQHSRKVKTKAKTISEATKKLDLKGTLGIEFKIFKLGGEIARGTEEKQGSELEVEWEVEHGLGSFKEFKQA